MRDPRQSLEVRRNVDQILVNCGQLFEQALIVSIDHRSLNETLKVDSPPTGQGPRLVAPSS